MKTVGEVMDAWSRGELGPEEAAEALIEVMPRSLLLHLRREARIGWSPPKGYTVEQWETVGRQQQWPTWSDCGRRSSRCTSNVVQD